MKQVYPDFYPSFHCLAGACPDTCCKDWEVVVDREALEFYKTVSGALGERLRDAFVRQPDGERCFRLNEEGKCVLLTADGLCPLQAAYGEKGLCKICASHPRFVEEYGATQEITLSISCPEAARLLLEHEGPIQFLTRDTEQTVDTPNTLDPERYFAVRAVREAALALVQDRSRHIRDRLSLLLLLCSRAQDALDAEQHARIEPLCARFQMRGVQERQLLRLRRMRRDGARFFPAWLLLRNMEHLTEDFPAYLERCAHAKRPDEAFFERHSAALEHLTVYFLFRYLLKASVDGALLARACSCVFHVLSISRIFCANGMQTPEELRALCSLYSKEVEHSEENLALLDRAIRRGALRMQTLLERL